ncbi:ComEA family DNA-binding protein [Olsenella sp. An293]|uniref:ComEA family DNA-binding protein n=1 Tax=Olsenella sp. An293 TaxID=1965626 RepID=UPI000B3AE020|nr:ComEA family DNA-binding protein [Olsenella sp. An293]OUO32148.1 hypothetical protein B5F85_07460 [Olsenella sp. An293]
MAQERRGGARRLAGRYGVAWGVAAAVALCAVLAGVTLLGVAGRDAVVIERADPAEAPAEPDEAGEQDAGEKDAGEKDAGEKDIAADEPPETVLVHVDGAVAAPGVYELPAGSRVNDAVLAAGGLAAGADTSGVNLAAPVSDGEKVRVPLEGEDVAPAVGEVTAGEGDEGDPAPVNLNTAGVEELDELPGVGEATARAIIEDREENGPFTSPEDLMRVSGIGEKKFARLEGLICV